MKHMDLLNMLFYMIIVFGAGVFVLKIRSWRYWAGMLIMFIGMVSYHEYNLYKYKKEITILEESILNLYSIPDYSNDFEYESYPCVRNDTIIWSVTTDKWTFDNSGIHCNSDSVFVVDIDSLQNKYKYYRLVIDNPVSDKINLMTVCYGDYDNWKKREVNGITQYSLDGTNWFEL